MARPAHLAATLGKIPKDQGLHLVLELTSLFEPLASRVERDAKLLVNVE